MNRLINTFSAPAPAPAANAARTSKSLMQVGLQMIGCPAAGKTLMTLAFVLDFIESYLRDLRISASDPRAYNALREELFDRLSGFSNKPMDPTLTARGLSSVVKHGGQRCIELQTVDPIGHIVPGVTLDSDDEWQDQYVDYCDGLAEANTLGVFIPAIPPDATPLDRMRCERNIRTCSAFLDQALEMRSNDSRVSVFIAGTKLDTLADSPEAARAALTDDVLKASFDDLVRLVRTSPKVSHAAIIPVTATGFDTMRLLEGAQRSDVLVSPTNGAAPASMRRDFIGEERPYVLKSDAVPQPFNVRTLLAWTLWAGAMPQLVDSTVTEHVAELDAVMDQLRQVLAEPDAWYVTVKSPDDATA